MPAFIQVIEYRTSKYDEIEQFMQDWRERNPQMGPNRVSTCADRDNPGSYVTIVEFSSYEEAMRNNDDPMTQEFAEFMRSVCDGPPVFRNLDVLRTEIRTAESTSRTVGA
jgi:hypothetical protein